MSMSKEELDLFILPIPLPVISIGDCIGYKNTIIEGVDTSINLLATLTELAVILEKELFSTSSEVRKERLKAQLIELYNQIDRLKINK